MFRRALVTMVAMTCIGLPAAPAQEPQAGAGARGGGQRGGGGRGGGTPASTMIKPGLFMISGIGAGATVVVVSWMTDSLSQIQDR
jgi:hypothetical protein